MREAHEIPKSWQWVTLRDVAEVVTGNTPQTSDPRNYGGNVPFFKPPQLVDLPVIDAPESLSESGLSAARLLPPKSVLVSCIGVLGKTALTRRQSATNQQINAVIFERSIWPEYGFYYSQTLMPWLKSHSSATTVAIVNKGKFELAPFPLPPRAEQTRIVEKLEELLSDLDAGVAELKSAQKKLAQYRQSLLKAAVEGALTADWRDKRRSEGSAPSPWGGGLGRGSSHSSSSPKLPESAHPLPSPPPQGEGTPESGAQQLARILKERRARWEAKQLAKFAEQGKTPPQDWQQKYPEPVQPDTTNLPELPEGWVWASVDQLLLDIETGKSFKCDERPPTAREIGVVKVSAVSWGEYDEEESKTCLDDEMVRPELFVKVGDFLFSRANTVELVGACVIAAHASKRIMLSDKILRFVMRDDLKSWLLAVLRSEFGRKFIERFASGNQESMRNIGQQKLRQIPVPLPSFVEIQAAETRLRSSSAQALGQELAIDLALKQSAAQRQNILRAAFAGQLVPQDPNDEPASVLLERIRAERAASEATKKPRGRKPKEAA